MRSLEGAGDRAAAVAIERVLVHHEAKPWSRQRKEALLDEIAPIPPDLLEEATTEVVRAQVFEPKPADWWTRVEAAVAARRDALRRIEAAIEHKRAGRPWTPPTPERRQAGLRVLAEIRQRLSRAEG